MDNVNSKTPDLVFIYPQSFPDEQIAEDISSIQVDNLDLKVLKKDNGPFNGFEWIIPTAFGAYLLKPYFDSFLTEAGKDHYNLLKKALNKLIEKGKQYKATVIAASQSTNKLSRTYSQSFLISLEFQTVNNRHLKLLFDDSLELTDWQSSVDQLLNLLTENYETYPHDKLTAEIEKLKTKEHRIIYVIVNPDTKQLEFKDDLKMVEKYT